MKYLKMMFGDVDHGTLMRLPYFGYSVLLAVLVFALMYGLMLMMGMNMMFLYLLMFVFYYSMFVLSVKRFRDMGMMHEKMMGFLFAFLGFMGSFFKFGLPMMMESMPMMHDMVMKFHLDMVFSVVSLVLGLMLLFVPSGYMKK